MLANLRLTTEQIQRLKQQGEDFKVWISSEKGKQDVLEHREHERYFKTHFSPENLNKITEDEFSEIWKKSWASKVWGNKDWNFKHKLIDPNGIDTIRSELNNLLYGTGDFIARYDGFRTKVKGFGVATLSEFLNMIFPEKFCLWNDKPKTVLPFLALDALPENLYKYNVATGEQYSQCINYMTIIKNELSEFGIKDFVDLDVFFWHIFEDVMPEQDKILMKSKQEFETGGITNLEDLILAFDKDTDFLGPHISEDDAMKNRAQFVADFPPDKILETKIDRYVLGKRIEDTNDRNRNTFCYHLEWGLKGFGKIGAGNPKRKFGIYYDHQEKRYVYDQNKFDSPEDAFTEILTQINTIIESGKKFTKDNDWKSLSDAFERIEELARPVKSKILSVYFPESTPSINSQSGVIDILRSLFGFSDEDIEDDFMLNKEKLWGLKENHPIMKNWSNFNYSYFVWYAWKNHANKTNSLPIQEKSSDVNQREINLWVVRAGGKGKQEETALDDNVITTAWNEFGDLSSVKDRVDLRKLYTKILPNDKPNTANAQIGQIWRFKDEIKIGDLVTLPRLFGHKDIVAIGKVVGDYEFTPLAPEVKHIRRVEWLKKDIPLSDFDPAIVKSLQIPMTVYQLKKNDALSKVVTVLKKYGIYFAPSDRIDDSKIKWSKIEHLVEETCMEQEVFEKWMNIIKLKKQIIFYGPPGTGKTFVAEAFAKFLTFRGGKYKIIQFHPSYGYEDFVEGIKPEVMNGGVVYRVVPGILKDMCDEAIKDIDPNNLYVLIIDEINRGQVPRIFGELIYTLEYRNREVVLPYSKQTFSIPLNLLIIGTMNSTDRSIAFLDYALRRRFAFFELLPDEMVLTRWFKKYSPTSDYSNLLNMFIELNSKIESSIGKEFRLGHSYFMIPNFTTTDLALVWEFNIRPLLEEYFFNDPDKLKQFDALYDKYDKILGQGGSVDFDKDISLSDIDSSSDKLYQS